MTDLFCTYPYLITFGASKTQTMSVLSRLSIPTLVCLFLFSCSSKPDASTEWEVYRQAIKRSDATTAIGALTRILAIDNTEPSNYDSLVVLYYKVGMDRAVVETAKQGLALHETETLVELSASSLKNLGKVEESLNGFLRLLEMRPTDIEVMYEVGFAYINLEKLDRAMQYVDLVIGHENSATTTMTEYVNQQSGQNVPFKAVALNMRGYILMQKGELSAAASAYQEALQIFPEYQLASNNLRFLMAQATGEQTE